MRKFPFPYAALTAFLLNALWVPGALAGEPAWLQPAALRKALCRQGPCFISLLKDVGRS